MIRTAKTGIFGVAAVTLLAAAAAAGFAEAGASAGKAMTHIKSADTRDIRPMQEPGVLAFLEDIVGSDDPVAPLTCGLFRLEKSKPLTYAYDYDEAKVILDGEMTVSDGISTVTATKGDVLFFPKGSNITFTTESSGLGFICGQRARDGA
jgi:ethanolamine utilization protein EutQ (cupin superfamily)